MQSSYRTRGMQGGIMGENAVDRNTETWQARATACELLALTFRYPDESTAEIASSGEWADAAREIWAALGKGLPETWAADVLNVDVHDICADATRLFVGSPKAACSPYESFWLAMDDGVQPLMFINPHAVDVERFCKACGLAANPDRDANDPVDHIATEFELMEYLASLEAGIAESFENGPAAADLPGGSAAAAYETFESEHLRSFAPRFADKLEDQARTPFYRAAAQLLRAFLS